MDEGLLVEVELDGGRGIDREKGERDEGKGKGVDGRLANGRDGRRGVRWRNPRDEDWDTWL